MNVRIRYNAYIPPRETRLSGEPLFPGEDPSDQEGKNALQRYGQSLAAVPLCPRTTQNPRGGARESLSAKAAAPEREGNIIRRRGVMRGHEELELNNSREMA